MKRWSASKKQKFSCHCRWLTVQLIVVISSFCGRHYIRWPTVLLIAVTRSFSGGHHIRWPTLPLIVLMRCLPLKYCTSAHTNIMYMRSSVIVHYVQYFQCQSRSQCILWPVLQSGTVCLSVCKCLLTYCLAQIIVSKQ